MKSNAQDNNRDPKIVELAGSLGIVSKAKWRTGCSEVPPVSARESEEEEKNAKSQKTNAERE